MLESILCSTSAEPFVNSILCICAVGAVCFRFRFQVCISVLNASCNLYAAVLFQLFARAQLAANVTSVGNLKVVQNKAQKGVGGGEEVQVIGVKQGESKLLVAVPGSQVQEPTQA